MLIKEKVILNFLEGLAPLSEGIKFLVVIFLFVFLVDSLLVFLGKEEGRKLPIKTYVAYLSVYLFYKLSVIIG